MTHIHTKDKPTVIEISCHTPSEVEKCRGSGGGGGGGGGGGVGGDGASGVTLGEDSCHDGESGGKYFLVICVILTIL